MLLEIHSCTTVLDIAIVMASWLSVFASTQACSRTTKAAAHYSLAQIQKQSFCTRDIVFILCNSPTYCCCYESQT